jgi:hypothetical protein
MATSKLFKDADEPSYDFLDPSANKNKNLDDHDNDGLKKPKPTIVEPPPEEYILGTLVVRVVAGRNLGVNAPSSKRRNTPKNINPYASVKFGPQTQRTSAVFDASDPLWPRTEAMYMDVALPAHLVTYKTDTQTVLPPPVVTVSLFHANEQHYNPSKATKKSLSGDSDDPFLGTASVDVTPLLTGKRGTLDKWFSLQGAGYDGGTVRIVCEYEASDPPPRVEDIVQFTRYCRACDLYPVPLQEAYKVVEVDHDDVVLEYTTAEGWLCTFLAHKNMVICQERHAAVLELAQEEILSITQRLSVSPIVREVQSTVDRVPEEGIINVGLGALHGAGSILSRWMKGGVETAVGDLQYATNWDGRFNERVNLETDDDQLPSVSVAALPDESSEDDDTAIALPGMPCCPITGLPMVDPVVAADGHTYERRAIQRWLHESDKSPLTGAVLEHKNLVVNYVLLSSVQEAASSREAAKSEMGKSDEMAISSSSVEGSGVEDDEEDKKMPAK